MYTIYGYRSLRVVLVVLNYSSKCQGGWMKNVAGVSIHFPALVKRHKQVPVLTTLILLSNKTSPMRWCYFCSGCGCKKSIFVYVCTFCFWICHSVPKWKPVIKLQVYPEPKRHKKVIMEEELREGPQSNTKK